MQTISATYRVTTPMFLGGVPSPEKEEAERLRLSPDHRAEFRLPSFKGALRFWWRLWRGTASRMLLDFVMRKRRCLEAAMSELGNRECCSA